MNNEKSKPKERSSLKASTHYSLLTINYSLVFLCTLKTKQCKDMRKRKKGNTGKLCTRDSYSYNSRTRLL